VSAQDDYLRVRNQIPIERIVTETFSARARISAVSAFEHWREVLRCPNCGLTGVATLSQPNDVAAAMVIDNMPVGFKAVSSAYGDTFLCEGCNRAATEFSR
jgi:hypothetical protein